MVKIRAASDIGGTFTDLVWFDLDKDTGVVTSMRAEKAHTTPPNFEQGVADAFDKTDIDFEKLDLFAHGTTVVINALTERKGVKTGLITTAGFRDILEIARGNRPDFFNLMYKKPEPFIPRYLRREVSQRMNYKGEVLEGLDIAGLHPILADFKAEGVEAVAISLLHAYANPSHEIAIADHIAATWPGVSVVCSHQITREWREYERSNTAALCAYVQPATEAYLTRLEDMLEGRGFDGSFYVMQSNGGIDTVAATRKIPIAIIESGPASGVLGAAALGELLGIQDIIAFDVGGTTAKCSLIEGGEVAVTSQYKIEHSRQSAGYPIMTPVVDIVEIGNGGGSIGWADAHSKLHVGPQSAGALPGPVAYGKGGTEPTTTDANLLLGRINPDYFIGGEIAADMDAVDTAFGTLGKPLGLDATEAARGVIRIANSNMTNALKLVSINRGHDPRDFTMIAFGGGGAMHATALASELRIPKVIIPAYSSVFSAWGMLMSDLRRDYILTKPATVTAEAAEDIDNTFRQLEVAAIKAYGDEGILEEKLRLERSLMMRYAGQEHTVRVPVASDAITAQNIDGLIDVFKNAYAKAYTYTLDNAVELVSFNLVAYANIERPQLADIADNIDTVVAQKGVRAVDFDTFGIHETPFFDRDKLGAGAVIAGPAIIEEAGTTTVVFPQQSLEVDRYGNLHIAIFEKADS